jgi:hypothetical protein
MVGLSILLEQMHLRMEKKALSMEQSACKDGMLPSGWSDED